MTVYLVGAGPGDPGLLTVRAHELLRRATLVVYDRLIEPRLLDLAPAEAERIDVGKVPGGPVHQDEINALLIERGTGDACLVRLKGGDPFVFGRGGEEALALQEAGVPFEVVPGISAALAVPAYAGVPVTHRGLSTSFTVVTGHSRFLVDRETNWEAIAAAGGTIVILMGVAHRADIAERLIRGGLDPTTPVTGIRWGTRPMQRTTRTTLAEMGAASFEPPVTLVIGSVAGLDLRWYESRPLFGRRVVVTRAREEASGLSDRLRALGAEPVELPTIRIAPPADGGAALTRAAARLSAGGYEWVAFTSANAVAPLLDRVHDARSFGTTRIAAVGPGTAAALKARGLVADLVPERAVAEGLLEAWPAPRGGRRGVLLPRAAVARDVLPDGLAAAGWEVEIVEAYRNEPERPDPDALSEVRVADAICFTSASTVENFLAVARPESLPPVVVCIGPVAAARAEKAGIKVAAVADPHTLEGLVASLCAVLSPR
ncbi:MAG: uroporphyrinogen-III C-methyltransferase [Acidimicrobiaceae bacterium]|nr:uroporphyrinogen-III C-methyltransferase [Acidimicrobiaceae bacterium]